MLLVEADVFNPEHGQDESDDAEWKIEKKDPVPACVGSNEAAEGWAENEGGESGPGNVCDGLGQLLLGSGAQDDKSAYGDHHCSANALQDAGKSELREGVRDSA